MIECLASVSCCYARAVEGGDGGWGGEGAKPGPLFISDIFLVPSYEMQHHLTNHNHSYYIMKISKDPNSVPVVGCTVKATPIGSHHP